MRKQIYRYLGLLWVAAAIAGCTTTSSVPVEKRNLAADVRDAASSQNSLLDVFPLSDPAAVELIRQARLAEDDNDLAMAIALVQKALAIVPKDPEYWQYQAELDLRREHYILALEHARYSFDLGPQVGQLCYRNWLTLTFAWEALYDLEEAQMARQRAGQCTLKERETY